MPMPMQRKQALVFSFTTFLEHGSQVKKSSSSSDQGSQPEAPPKFLYADENPPVSWSGGPQAVLRLVQPAAIVVQGMAQFAAVSCFLRPSHSGCHPQQTHSAPPFSQSPCSRRATR